MIKKRIDVDAGNNRRIIVVRPLWDYPITRGTVLLYNGAYLDGKKNGLSGVFYDLLNERSKLNEKLEKLGAKIRAQNALTKSFINFAFLNLKIKKSFKLLSEFIGSLEFNENDFEIVRKKRIDRIAILEEDPEFILSRNVHKIVYSGSSLANSTYGTKNGIENITLRDVEGFYTNVFAKSHVDIIVVSSYKTQKIVEFVEGIIDYFDGSFLKPPEEPEKYAAQSVKLSKKHITNAYLSFFTPVLIENEEDYLSLKLLSYILGEGSFNARLLNRLREELGLVYYASSGLNRGFVVRNMRFPGYFDVIAETGKENVDRVSIEIEKIRDEVLSGKIKENELEVAKNYYIGLERRRGETYKDILNTILTERIYKLERNYYTKIKEQIKRIGMKEIIKAASLLRSHRFSRIILEGESEERQA